MSQLTAVTSMDLYAGKVCRLLNMLTVFLLSMKMAMHDGQGKMAMLAWWIPDRTASASKKKMGHHVDSGTEHWNPSGDFAHQKPIPVGQASVKYVVLASQSTQFCDERMWMLFECSRWLASQRSSWTITMFNMSSVCGATPCCILSYKLDKPG
jgi:hypothetical protein